MIVTWHPSDDLDHLVVTGTVVEQPSWVGQLHATVLHFAHCFSCPLLIPPRFMRRRPHFGPLPGLPGLPCGELVPVVPCVGRLSHFSVSGVSVESFLRHLQ